jgi:peptidyl-tRNA hydrolase, PTH1 family
MYLIIGLGNPGKKYNGTRHNIGFDVVTSLANCWNGAEPNKKSFGALVSDCSIKGESTLLALPQQYMNRSGQPVASLKGYYKIPNDNIIVVHDDLDLESGVVRCKKNGGHGGHNGLRDIIKHVGNDFLRIRVGIGRPPTGWETSNYVLGRWNAKENDILGQIKDDAVRAIEGILQDGIDATMNKFNIRNSKLL